MDYELEYNDAEYYVGHENGEVTIYENGGADVLFHVRWFNGALPEKVAAALIDAYKKGYKQGRESGYFSCQYDMRKVLGL